MSTRHWTADDIPDQHGRTVMVTGANSGLGLRTSEALARKGARVLLACRNPDKAADALAHVTSVATGEPPVAVPLDLADLASVRACAARVHDEVGQLDVLVNNAGIMAIPRTDTADGFEMQLGTNHLGHFALTAQLLPVLRRAAAPRVITVASGAHRFGRVRFDDLMGERTYGPWRAYSQSKLANLLFAFELQRRADAAGVPLVSAAAHPGYAATHLQAVSSEMTGSSFKLKVMNLGNRLFAQTDAMGALPSLYAATMPDVRGGDYYGPSGIGELQGYPRKVKGIKRSHDLDTARRLWERSEELTGVSFELSSSAT